MPAYQQEAPSFREVIIRFEGELFSLRNSGHGRKRSSLLMSFKGLLKIHHVNKGKRQSQLEKWHERKRQGGVSIGEVDHCRWHIKNFKCIWRK